MTDALKQARDALVRAETCILVDRTALLDCHTGPDGIDDGGAAALDDYDDVLLTIRAAIARADAAQAAPVAWRKHVENRMLTWKQRLMNRSGDRLGLDDFMDAESLDDLVDFVCDEWEEPAGPPAPAAQDEQPEAETSAQRCYPPAFDPMPPGTERWPAEHIWAHACLTGWRAAQEPAQADARDAARYRLLRRGQHWSVIDGIGDVLRAEALDAAIDAAQAKPAGGAK